MYPTAMLETVLAYHERTKHGYRRFARSRGSLDWATQPHPFRRFEGALEVPLPFGPVADAFPYDGLYAPSPREPAPLDAAGVGDLLLHSLAISAWKQAGHSRWALRVNPSSGNLHPTEGYVLLPAVPGISAEPGVYHYAPETHVLERRCRLSRESWEALTAGLPQGSFLVGLSSIHWREEWKYGERAFRYCQHDTGHAVAALRLAAALRGWRLRLLTG
ncbi:MAG: SagB/ThcOx family dehydrogenase, partial [Planctomycetota bacterium]